MNYLAHAYLSFDIPEIVTGNMISDFVKGRRKSEFPLRIRTGISLHRAIDGFTDTHPATHRAKSYFRREYGLYSGPLTDILYDHFLANDPTIFPEAGDLSRFAASTYAHLAGFSDFFPERFARLFPYMRDMDWFSGYRTFAGIFASLGGLARRAKYMPAPDAACRLFETHYAALRDCYLAFFPDLAAFAAGTLAELEREGGTEKIG
ncbi:MAG TPA: ACP phosphodiesterase [Puia sp.]|nr:ACP phosphodiesterase [Puia sp.]